MKTEEKTGAFMFFSTVYAVYIFIGKKHGICDGGQGGGVGRGGEGQELLYRAQ